MRTQARRPRRVLIRGHELRKLALDRYGCTSGVKMAEHLGVDATTLNRLIAGRGHPSSILIATLLDALDVKFEDLFVIAPLVEEHQQAA